MVQRLSFFSNGLLYGYYCALCCSDFPATTHQETLRLHLTSHGHKLSYFRRQYFTSYKEITQWPAYGNDALRDFDLEEYFEDEVLKLNAKEFAQEKCRKCQKWSAFRKSSRFLVIFGESFDSLIPQNLMVLF